MTLTAHPQTCLKDRTRALLTDKTVLVTGASRGIGASCALRCAAAGARRVVVLGRSLPELERVAEQIRQTGVQSEPLQCDVTQTTRLRKAIKTVGQIDVLIASAGANRPQPFLDVEEETYDWLFDLNVRATFFAAQAAARQMHDGGAIVIVSSQMGHVERACARSTAQPSTRSRASPRRSASSSPSAASESSRSPPHSSTRR